MTAPLRVAVIGAGIGVRYAESFQRLADAEVVALCAASPRQAVPASERLGIPRVYTDFRDMLRDCAPEVVAIVTPNFLHHQMTLAAIASGAHVLCDKPLAMNSTQAAEMLAAAEQRGVRHVIPFWWHFVPHIAAARELLGDGSLGEPYLADVRLLSRGWGDPHGPMRWQFDRAQAGSGALANLGSHAIHILQWLIGPIERVCAATAVNVRERTSSDGRLARPDAEDTAAFVATLGNGAPVSFIVSSVAHETRTYLDATFQLSCGSLAVAVRSDDAGHVIASLTTMRSGEIIPHEVPIPSTASDSPAVDIAYSGVITELVAAIRENRPAQPGFTAGLDAQCVIDAALASVEHEKWVTVDRTVGLPLSGSC